MGTEPIIAPDGVPKEEARVAIGRHLLPDIADGFQFGDHGAASLRGNPKKLASFSEPEVTMLWHSQGLRKASRLSVTVNSAYSRGE